MAEDTTDDLRKRHADIMEKSSKQASKGSMRTAVLVALLSTVCTGALVWGLFALRGSETLDTGIPVSRTSDFPEDRPAQETLDLPATPPVIQTPRSTVPQTDSATLARLADLEAELEAARDRADELEAVTEREEALQIELEQERERFRAQLAALRSSAQNDQDRARETEARLQETLESLSADIERQRSADAAERQAEELRLAEERRARESEFQRELDELRRRMQAEIDAAETIDPLQEERLRLEATRLQQEQDQRAALQAERERRRAAEQERISSSISALGGGSGAEEGQGNIDRVLSAAERFVNRGIAEVPVSQASRIALPSATVPQGTIVQASLETAIDSSLPGVIRAVVSEDVHSLDGSAVLIPAGSKIFGEYDAGIELGQRRILIAWTRILTPSNRSISIASYGADGLGRSGSNGVVDTRFWTRFGNAAAISILGGGANAIEDRVSSNAAGDAASDVAGSVVRESSNALSEAFSIAPRIYVRQGSSVSVILDRDLEIL